MTHGLEYFPDRRPSRYEAAIEGELIGQPVLPRPVQRATTYAVAKQLGRGAVGRTRIATTGQVAEAAIDYLNRLEAEEAAAAARDQMNAGHRQRRIVDAFTTVADDAVRTTGRAFPC
jgi:hypothetical protein